MTEKTKKTTTADKNLQDFIQNVNKKDELSGLKIRFAFVNRKRKG